MSGSVSRVSQRNCSRNMAKRKIAAPPRSISLCEEEHDSNSSEQFEERESRHGRAGGQKTVHTVSRLEARHEAGSAEA